VILAASGRGFWRFMLVQTRWDLWTAGLTLHRVRPAQEVVSEGATVAEWLARRE
jgi:hypothetical protein